MGREVAAPTVLWVPGASPSVRVVQAVPARLLRFAGDLLLLPPDLLPSAAATI